MKKTFKLLFIALLAMGMFACGEKKQTYQDMKKIEATLFDENGYLDTLQAPKVAEKYCQFVKQNPDDSTNNKVERIIYIEEIFHSFK